MSKIAKPLQFYYTLKHKVVRDLKIVTEHVGVLRVTGTAYMNPLAPPTDPYERYTVDIDFILWNGMNIMPVLEVTGGLDEIIEKGILEASEQFEKAERRERA